MTIQSNIIRHIAISASAMLMIGGLSAPAFAAASSAPSVSMKIDKAELATARGVERVYAAIVAQANSACETHVKTGISRKLEAKVCTVNFISDIVTQVSDDRLSAYHASMRA